MDSVQELVNSIQKICDGTLTEYQIELITNLLNNSSWFPNKKDHVYIFRLYKEMKIAAECELALLQEKANLNHNLDPEVDKLAHYLDNITKIVDNYTNAFTYLMNTYDLDKPKAFMLFYFKGYELKQVSQELPWVALGTLKNWKVQFQKDIDNINFNN